MEKEIDKEILPYELADRWRMSVGTLKVWRSTKKGPGYNKRGGKVTYSLSVIVAYEEKNKITIS